MKMSESIKSAILSDMGFGPVYHEIWFEHPVFSIPFCVQVPAFQAPDIWDRLNREFNMRTTRPPVELNPPE
jgi:hypothetical protein